MKTSGGTSPADAEGRIAHHSDPFQGLTSAFALMLNANI